MECNRRRQACCPVEPTTLDFVIQDSAIPAGFLQADIRVGQKRHVVFYSDHLQGYLSQAREWYVDGTFKYVGAPFTQLWSIHVFLKDGDSVKQVPVLFALMSGKSCADYTAILRHIVSTPLDNLFNVVMDFEAAVWKAFSDVLPNVTRKGCHFHWTQAVWRKVQDLGLAGQYMENAAIQKFIRRVMCLPFLPSEHIIPINDIHGQSHHADGPPTPQPVRLYTSNMGVQ